MSTAAALLYLALFLTSAVPVAAVALAWILDRR